MHVTEPPNLENLLAGIAPERIASVLAAPVDPRSRADYLHWDKLRHLEPPAGLTSEEWWLQLKLGRKVEWRQLPLLDADGRPFGYTVPAELQRLLHLVDQVGGAGVGPHPFQATSREVRDRLFVASRMEEAIRSSQLEGATTSKGDAKEMLRSGRPARDRSEQMITNNYEALRFMRDMGPILTPESVLELHRVVTANTLAEPGAAGRLQRPKEERVRVYDRDGGRVVHVPPPADQLPERMRMLCDFANARRDAEPFIHPVLRAILLHFWLAYDHPFVDGNGRTARILFFWAMRAQGYWLGEYLPISQQLRSAPSKYGKAFLEAETDDGDATYFLSNQLGVLERSIDELDRSAERQATERREVKRLLDDIDEINGRQLVLLNHALKHPGHAYTLGGHAHSNRVTHETARTDLNGLADLGFLERRRLGRSYSYLPAPDLPERLKESTA